MSTSTDLDEVLAKLNKLVRKLFKIERAKTELKQSYTTERESAKAQYEAELSKLDAQATKLKQQLTTLVKQNRGQLIKRGKSFATLFGKFSLRNVAREFKVTDKTAALKTARKLGIVRKVCNIQVTYTVDTDKLKKYLDSHPEHHKDFDAHVEWGGEVEEESLSAKPNDTYLTKHDPKRVSVKAVTLGVIPN